MFNICIRMMGNRADAEDVLQESFIIAFKNLQQLKDAQQFAGWLKRIVINECIKQSKKAINTIAWDETANDKPDEEEEHWWQGIEMADIHHHIKSLPNGCRQIFTLYALEDYSHKDIAAQMNISESTSKSQYHRAKQLLKQSLTKTLVANQHG